MGEEKETIDVGPMQRPPENVLAETEEGLLGSPGVGKWTGFGIRQIKFESGLCNHLGELGKIHEAP